eukprot:TRINITY_DN482_c0_g1_i1.p1 TRINITY_DN482_c0_g1~~TRINITY_DN482_c0_g1_i1.p1  ORF type:complete len:290 (-),score=81.46 TRINITY_DN482_c0_g1_i1:50-919(-)
MMFKLCATLLAFSSLAARAADSYLPVVLMHGLGDAGTNSGMQSLAKSISTKYPGLYSTAVSVADGLSSYFELMEAQLQDFVKVVRSDANLANGFNLVGISQGGLLVRAYVERYNDPPVHNLISICGPQSGVGTCPEGTPDFLCSFFASGPYTASLSFAGYWKDVTDEATYLKESPFLADINNERAQKNQTYKDNMLKLNKYVLIKALNDTVIYPGESEWHGFWAWGDSTKSKIVEMRDTEAYSGDWIGLKTLDQQKKLDLLSFEGEHIRFTQQFWDEQVMPYFDVKLAH